MIHYFPNQKQAPRLGLVVSKKVAKLAVHRNYMRRVLRELYKNNQYQWPALDLVIRVQRFFSQADFAQIEQEISQLAQKLIVKTANNPQ